jgi:CRP-like cAMP-binding protein
MAVALVVYLLVRVSASGVNLAAIAIPSTVITAALAFSLQATLGNLWGGIALQLDNTCRIGDWIRFEGVTGQIVSIRWRYLAMATTTNETVIIPNAKLVNNHVHVLGRRGDFRVPLRHTVPFAVVYSVPPSQVIAIVRDALLRSEIPTMAMDPPPQCVCLGFDDNGIQYGAIYWLTDLGRDMGTDSDVRVHVYAALQRHGMQIPYPHRVLIRDRTENREAALNRELEERGRVLAQVPLFSAFTADERRALASELVTCNYVGGDVVSRHGDVADCLYILSSGTVTVYGAAQGNEPRPRLAVLTAPDYFGEMGVLTGQPRTATIVTEGEATCYRLDKPGFDAILRARPALVDALSEVIADRQSANDKTLALSAEARARQANTRATELVRRIRQFFDLR